MGTILEESMRYFEAAGFSDDEADTFTMVVCELVENGIKYGHSRKVADRKLKITVSVKDDIVTVQVSNSVGRGSKSHLQRLDRTIQWVRGFQDPFEAFLERMKEISREPLNLPKSGLGIVRIAYEGRAALDFFLGEDNTLSVLAVSKIERTGGV